MRSPHPTHRKRPCPSDSRKPPHCRRPSGNASRSPMLRSAFRRRSARFAASGKNIAASHDLRFPDIGKGVRKGTERERQRTETVHGPQNTGTLVLRRPGNPCETRPLTPEKAPVRRSAQHRPSRTSAGRGSLPDTAVSRARFGETEGTKNREDPRSILPGSTEEKPASSATIANYGFTAPSPASPGLCRPFAVSAAPRRSALGRNSRRPRRRRRTAKRSASDSLENIQRPAVASPSRQSPNAPDRTVCRDSLSGAAGEFAKRTIHEIRRYTTISFQKSGGIIIIRNYFLLKFALL